MSPDAFYLAGNDVLFVANGAGGDHRYRAERYLLPPRAQVPGRRHDTDETIIVVVAGILEFMVGGAVGPVTAGNFIRVPAGTSYAFGNLGDEPATLLIRTIAPQQPAPAVNVTISFAAA